MTAAGSDAGAIRRFPLHLGRWSRYTLLVFGVRPSNAYVDLGPDLDAHFGWFGLRTPMANVAAWRIEGPWRSITAVGVRRSIRHGDLTFGGTARGGVRLDFIEPIDWHELRTPALYVTVDDMEGFTAALVERGIEGVDARASGRGH